MALEAFIDNSLTGVENDTSVLDIGKEEGAVRAHDKEGANRNQEGRFTYRQLSS